MPSPSKLGSSSPFAVYRATTVSVPTPVVIAQPATTSLPSLFRTIAYASAKSSIGVVTMPPVPNAGSSVPCAV